MRKAARLDELFLRGWHPYIILILLGCLFLLPGLKRLPPTDRDEARFAQASRQMLETENFVDIRFQAKPRYKKPIGIYWLQAASAAIAGNPERRVIWPYRLPSFLGALFAILLTFQLGKSFFDAKSGFLAALLLGSSILLQVEARIATTDAVLLACIVAMQGALGKIYLAGEDKKTRLASLFFWMSCGAGILVKGPVPVLIALLTICALLISDKNLGLVRRMHPLTGFCVLAGVVFPWFLAIHLASGGQFVKEAFLSDVLPKLLGGQESHGMPPGFYMVLFPFLFWPGSLVAFPGLGAAWKLRGNKAVRFLLSWIIPTWLVFEFIPTKLPHYILPVFPAIALLTGYYLVHGFSEEAINREGKKGFLTAFYKGAFIFVTLLVGGGVLAIDLYFKGTISAADGLVCLGAAGVIWVSATWERRRNIAATAILCLVGVGLVIDTTFFSILPSARSLWISREVASMVAKLPRSPSPVLASVGYHEPSLVFLLGTGTRLLEAGEAAEALRKREVTHVLVTKTEKPTLIREAQKRGMALKTVARMRGFNYSKGRWLNLFLVTPDRDF